MKAYVILFRQFILRALLRQKLRTLITALGVALGVGVTVAIRLANASALESFRTATESIAGQTSIQITGAAGRFDELRLGDLGWLRDYGDISPVITGYAMTDPRMRADSPPAAPSSSVSNATKPLPRYGEFLEVLGVDVLRERPFREYRLIRTGEGEAQPNARDFLLLLADPSSIVVTETFAARHRLNIGDRLALTMGEARREYVVRGLLANEGPARAMQGNFVLMDIAAAQWAFNRLGLLDRVDVKLKRDIPRERAEAEISSRLPASLVVRRPEAGASEVEKMIAAFHFNLNALGSIALVVGLFLIYNTISISVITRRDEIGTLRALGTTRRTTLLLFLGEAILLALAGTIVGLVLGRLMAAAAVKATATTVEIFFIATAATRAAAQHALSLSEIAIAFAVALPLSLLAAAVPALEAARVRPIEAMRGAERLEKTFKPSRKFLVASLTLLLAGYLLTLPGPVGGIPVFADTAALVLMFGGAALAPNALWLACQMASRLIARWFSFVRVEAKLAAANLRNAIPRLSISVAALAVALAMMTAISVMVGSFRETVAYWVDQTLVADVYARPLTQSATNFAGEIDAQAIALVKKDPAVITAYASASQPATYQGEAIVVSGGDFTALAGPWRLLFKSPADGRAAALTAIGTDRIIVNESFSLRYHKRVGDVIELPTAAGPQPFEIVAIYFDYANSRGVCLMDATAYARHYPYARPNSLAVYLKPEADADEVTARLAENVGGRYQLLFTTNRVIRREVMRIFDSTFAITYALEAIALIVAALGVISTLITLILERRGEISVLGFLGATRRQIRRMVVIESLLIGGVSQGIGLLIGLMLSLVLIYVINVQSFGWTIQFHLPVGFLAQSTLLMLLVTALAGLYPAARAARVEAVRFAREE
ncbi:MAG TPA: ABC transporter permease [Blastocatellia bacterium]|nr:ABC transporter permease [Blastocatellia bacterium]